MRPPPLSPRRACPQPLWCGSGTGPEATRGGARQGLAGQRHVQPHSRGPGLPGPFPGCTGHLGPHTAASALHPASSIRHARDPARSKSSYSRNSDVHTVKTERDVLASAPGTAISQQVWVHQCPPAVQPRHHRRGGFTQHRSADPSLRRRRGRGCSPSERSGTGPPGLSGCPWGRGAGRARANGRFADLCLRRPGRLLPCLCPNPLLAFPNQGPSQVLEVRVPTQLLGRHSQPTATTNTKFSSDLPERQPKRQTKGAADPSPFVRPLVRSCKRKWCSQGRRALSRVTVGRGCPGSWSRDHPLVSLLPCRRACGAPGSGPPVVPEEEHVSKDPPQGRHVSLIPVTRRASQPLG